MVQKARDRFGAIDVLINCVGGNVGLDAFAESDPTTWQQDIDLNIDSTLNCTQAVLPGMIDRGGAGSSTSVQRSGSSATRSSLSIPR